MCKVGSILTPEQAKILQLLDFKLATFHFVLRACWIKDEGFEKLREEEQQEEADIEIEDDDDE